MIASVEANGWVLRVTIPATPGSFASYTLDPDGAPRVVLSMSHSGYSPVSGSAAATTLVRSVVATKPLRKPVNPASPTTPVIDEVDNGDGTITLRLALSEFVHATDTGLTLTTLAGWRNGEFAGTITVSNASTMVAPIPIFRWADVPYQRQTGPFTLEVIVFSHHPLGTAPVAGVKFSVTDGSNVRTGWATAMSTSSRHGDAARVYAATIDPAGLNAGLLRCDAEIHPWLGSVRSTDAAGTRSMAGLAVAGYGSKAETPFVIGYDPAGTRYGGQVLFVDPAGTATAAATMVKPDLATARAMPAASRPRDVATALKALYLSNRSLAAANGQPAAVRSADGARIVLAARTHSGPGTTAVTAGLTTSELAVIIEGDPNDANPRQNVVLQTAAAAAGARITRTCLRRLSFEIGATTFFSAAQIYYWFDEVEIRGKAGSETNSVSPISAVTPTAGVNLFATQVRYWRSGSGLRGASMRFGLLRNCEWARRADGLCVIGGRYIPATEDVTQVSVAEVGVSGWAAATDLGALEDVIVAGVDLRSVKGRAWAAVGAPAATAGTPNPSLRRLVFANNLCERIGPEPTPFWSMGEDDSATISYNIIEGNSFVGERCNIMYGDPLPVTLAEVNSQVNQAFGNRIANNSFDWAATKHDAFNDSQSSALRGGTGGYRPQMTETWSVTYGVNFEANFDWGRDASSGNFRFEWFGRRSMQMVGGVPAWPLDRSHYSATPTGGGSYKPPPGSPLIGRAQRGSIDRDRTGAARNVPFASGAVETSSAIALAPAATVLAGRASAVPVSWFTSLGPVQTRLAIASRAAAIGWNGDVGPARGRLAGQGRSVSLGVSVALNLAAGALTSRDAGAAVLPDLPFDVLFATPRMVRIAGEFRVQLVAAD